MKWEIFEMIYHNGVVVTWTISGVFILSLLLFEWLRMAKAFILNEEYETSRITQLFDFYAEGMDILDCFGFSFLMLVCFSAGGFGMGLLWMPLLFVGLVAGILYGLRYLVDKKRKKVEKKQAVNEKYAIDDKLFKI